MAEDGSSKASRRRTRWRCLVEGMVADCRRGNPRDVTFWAQQLAYAPVVPHALSLWLRNRTLVEEDRAPLVEAIRLGEAGLDALPDVAGQGGASLSRLAARQARALAFGRRGVLLRLVRRLGPDLAEREPGDVPSRMLRFYPLIGWDPPVGSGEKNIK